MNGERERPLLTYARKIRQRVRDILPRAGFHFDRPILLLQSDDWGRVGLRDQEGLQQLRSAGLVLGERPYDFYTLETAGDIVAIRGVLSRHRDSTGRSPILGMNFVVANLDFKRMAADDFRGIHLVPLTEGLPEGWERPGLLDGYHEGIAEGLFYPALHGTTHFCRATIERHLTDTGERGALLRRLWQAGTPYIHWRMPWIGYEYWDPEQPEDERFLPAKAQRDLIGQAVGTFAKVFSTLPRSACSPGYRANDDTYRVCSEYGILVGQNGPRTLTPPHIDRHGILQIYRSVEFEPATDPAFSVETCVREAENCFARGIPAIVSLHSINFHSTVKDFRGRTLQGLDQLLSALEAKHPNLLYLHDQDLHDLVSKGSYGAAHPSAHVNVTKRNFTRSRVSVRQES